MTHATTWACHGQRRLGFTLLEVLIVVLMVAILAALALPQYDEHVRRSHRAHAKAALQHAAMWMERAATATGRYPLTSAFPAALQATPSRRYIITLDSVDGASWTLTATRAPDSAQAGDRCGDLTLRHTGERGLNNQARGLGVLDCWDR